MESRFRPVEQIQYDESYVKWVSRFEVQTKELKTGLAPWSNTEPPLADVKQHHDAMTFERLPLSSLRCRRPTVPGDPPNDEPPITNNSTYGVPDSIVCKVHVIEVQVPPIAPDLIQRNFFSPADVGIRL